MLDGRSSTGPIDPIDQHARVRLGTQQQARALTAGRGLDRAKLLYFDRGGFVLIYKRLEKGRFKLPVVKPTDESIEIDGAQLAMLLDGIDFARVRRPPLWKPPVPSSINRPIDPEPRI
jgi:transposase